MAEHSEKNSLYNDFWDIYNTFSDSIKEFSHDYFGNFGPMFDT